MTETRNNKTWLRLVQTTAVGIPLLMTVACASDYGPYPMPTGYKYHNEQFKTPPGPEPVYKKWKHRNEPREMCTKTLTGKCSHHTATAAPHDAPAAEMPGTAMWHQAAREMVARLTAKFGLATEGVYIEPEAGAAADPAFEHALAEEFAGHGVLRMHTGHAPFGVLYRITPPGSFSGDRVMVDARILSGGRTAAEASGAYHVPGYTPPMAPAMSVTEVMDPAPAAPADDAPAMLTASPAREEHAPMTMMSTPAAPATPPAEPVMESPMTKMPAQGSGAVSYASEFSDTSAETAQDLERREKGSYLPRAGSVVSEIGDEPPPLIDPVAP